MTVATMLQRRLEDEHDGPTENQSRRHHPPKNSPALFSFRTFERVSTVPDVALRSLPRMLFEEVGVFEKKLLSVDAEELRVIPNEAADKWKRR